MDYLSFREIGISHLEAWGEWFSEIEFTGGGEFLGLHLIPPNKVRSVEKTKSGETIYKVEGSKVPIPSWKMFHVKIGGNGLRGTSPLLQGREAIGLGMAAERFGATWFGNGSIGQSVLKHPEKLDDKSKVNLRESIEHVHRGPDRANRIMILEEGMTLEQIGVAPDAAQFLSTRLFQLQEICRLIRVPPAIVYDLSQGTFSNTEQQMTSFVVGSVTPLCRRIEAEVNRKLYTEAERREFFSEHLIDGLMRGDAATRNATYAIGRQWGWLSVNDVRGKENMDGIGEEGDVYLNPLNMVPASAYLQQQQAPQQVQQAPVPRLPGPTLEQKPEEKPQDASFSANPQAVCASLYCLQDNLERMLRKEAETVRKYAAKPEKFLQNVEQFYSGQANLSVQHMDPSVTAYAAVSNRDGVPQLLADLLVKQGQEQLIELSGKAKADTLAEAVEEWIGQRQAKAVEILMMLGK